MKVMSTPKHVDIAITGKCNLACQYCFYADEMVAHARAKALQESLKSD